MYIYIYIIYWAPRAIYCVQAMKTAHLLITFSFSLPRETSKSQAGMRQLWVVLTHSHQDPEILHAIGGWYLAWDYLSIWTRAMVLMLPMWWNLSPEVWFSVLPLPANHVCGLRYWGWLMWQFCLAEYHIESERWGVRDWGPKFSYSHKPCLSLDDMRLISYCYFHNSCRSQLKFSGHIQPVYNNHWLEHEFETKIQSLQICKRSNRHDKHHAITQQLLFPGFLEWLMLVFPEIMVTHNQRENRALLGAFFCRRSFRDNFPRNYSAIKNTCSLCLYDQSDLCKSYDIVSTMIKWI